MSSIEEKRRFDAGADTRAALVATGMGLAHVEVAGDRLGEVGLLRQCVAHDLALGDELIALATDEGVVLGATPAELAEADPEGFDAPTAVGITDDGVLAGDSSGRVARVSSTEDGWRTLGSVESVTAIDGGLIGTTGGVYRAVGKDLRHAGLDAVWDVASAVVPHAATADGLYRLGNGWIDVLDGDVLDGDVRTVAIDAETASGGTLGRAHAATSETCYAHTDGEWFPVEVSTHDPVADAAYADGSYLLTTGGTLLAEDGDGWRHHVLGLVDASAIEVVPSGMSE